MPESERRISFEFHANGGEYFRIWIVNLLLTIVTFGIYSAWAKVRRLRYLYGNTRLDGAAFDYHGRPIQILKGRLIAFGAYATFYVGLQVQPLVGAAALPFFVVGVPWIIQRARRFQMRMTSYRGLRFGFDGTYGGAFTAYVGWFFAALATLYLLYPLWHWKRVAYLLNHSRYGTERFRMTATSGRFYAFNLATGAMVIATFVAIAVAIGIATSGEPPDAALTAEDASNPFAHLSTAWIAGVAATGVLAAFVIAAYYQKSYLNAVFDGLELGPHRVACALETAPLLGIMLSNFVLVVLTLGLYTPWAQIRQLRYQLARSSLIVAGDLDAFVAAAGESADALGEEIGDFFDVDFGL